MPNALLLLVFSVVVMMVLVAVTSDGIHEFVKHGREIDFVKEVES